MDTQAAKTMQLPRSPIDATLLKMLKALANAVLTEGMRWRFGDIRNILSMPIPDGELAWRSRHVRHIWAMPTPFLHERECPMCGFSGRFEQMGYPPRPEGRCPSCQSVERHRLFSLWLKANPDAISGTVLHFAPEGIVRSMLEPRATHYRGVDLDPDLADEAMNIEATGLVDGSIDCIFCSHVLEHVDDRLALPELHRILAPGGLAIFMFPVIEGWDETYENPKIETERNRDLHFGQIDHIRYYGADVRQRITSVGFTLTEYTAVEPDVSRYSLLRGEKLFLARK